jgi:hypothetical protein
MSRRLRLSLGDRQVDALILALGYAIETFAAEWEDGHIEPYERRQIAEWERVREVIRRERYRRSRQAEKETA